MPVGCSGTRWPLHGDGETVADEPARLDLQAFERAVHVTHRAAAAGFFAEHVPRFERGAQFDLHIALRQIADARETKFKMRREPLELERITGLAQIADDILEIRFAKMRQHPAVMNVRAPAHEAVCVRLLPEFRDEAAQQEMLREAHPRVRRHFERAHLDEAEPAAAAFRRE